MIQFLGEVVSPMDKLLALIDVVLTLGGKVITFVLDNPVIILGAVISLVFGIVYKVKRNFAH